MLNLLNWSVTGTPEHTNSIMIKNVLILDRGGEYLILQEKSNEDPNKKWYIVGIMSEENPEKSI